MKLKKNSLCSGIGNIFKDNILCTQNFSKFDVKLGKK